MSLPFIQVVNECSIASLYVDSLGPVELIACCDIRTSQHVIEVECSGSGVCFVVFFRLFLFFQFCHEAIVLLLMTAASGNISFLCIVVLIISSKSNTIPVT